MSSRASDPPFNHSLLAATQVRPVNADSFEPLGFSRSHWIDRLEKVGDVVQIDEARPELGKLSDVLEKRNSIIEGGPIDRDSVVALLDLLARTRSQQQDAAGRWWRSRLFPSAGGVHSIEPLIFVNSCDAMHSGWYRRGTGGVDEVQVPDGTRFMSDALDALGNGWQPAAVLFAASEPRLTSDRYPGGESLLWRDAGVFLGLAHLLATALGHSSTILGSVSITQEPSESWPSAILGALALGGRIPA